MAKRHFILISMFAVSMVQAMDNAPPASGSPYQEFACVGDAPALFKSPLDTEVLIQRANRVLPLQLQLIDSNSIEISDQQINSPPVVQVMFLGEINGDEIPDELKNSGRGNAGNTFKYRNHHWQFGLSTSDYSAPGRYSVTVEAGDDSYIIDPACTATFVVQ